VVSVDFANCSFYGNSWTELEVWRGIRAANPAQQVPSSSRMGRSMRESLVSNDSTRRVSIFLAIISTTLAEQVLAGKSHEKWV
jgi:hypothetical protein